METSRTGPAGETIDTPQHRALGSASRVAIMRLVRNAATGLTAGEIAERAGLHFSTVRAHLDRLIEAGLLVKARASDGTPGRPAWRYMTAAPAPAPAPYRTLAAALLEHLATDGGGVPAAVTAGQAWGRRLAGAASGLTHPIDSVVAVLRQLGFDPQPQPASASTDDVGAGPGRKGPARGPVDGDAAGAVVEVHLRACPFLGLVGQQPDLMCSLHAGMIRGVLEGAGAPDPQAALEPFAAPNGCIARMRAPETRQPALP